MWDEVGFSFNHDGIKRKTENRLILWSRERLLLRLWDKDPSLWDASLGDQITDRLGWLDLPARLEKEVKKVEDFNNSIDKKEISHLVLLGMGGSSLAAQMLYKTLSRNEAHPELSVLSSTHPESVREIEDKIDPMETIFIVSSKSGTTLETLSFFRYFWSLMNKYSAEPGRHFIAITDPGSYLDDLAEKRNFLKIFHAPQDVGGRFSAFTSFGIVPASLGGADIKDLIIYAQEEMRRNKTPVPEQKADGIVLGALLGELALAGKDKLTFITDSALTYFPYWLEQLIAESLGKKGKGIIPVVDEPQVPIEGYGKDRAFIRITCGSHPSKDDKQFIESLASKGFPVLDFNLENKVFLGRELCRWEIAVAAAGAVFRVNPFDQPDVQRSKKFTLNVMEKSGNDKIEGIKAYSIEDQDNIRQALSEIFPRTEVNRYIAIHAYLHQTAGLDKELEDIRFQLVQKTHFATTLGYGPSFLHSSGQMHKGGRDVGIFIQLVDEPAFDLTVPETDYSFFSMIKAQAAGDYQALREQGRRVIRINLGKSGESGLKTLSRIIQEL
ncbi:MAG: hypothetical protein JW755_04430 [Candidatus Aminicenantes bacterium]|nr:hypothetical protein [Candidatus Aminicenantes bacterium]